MHGSNQLSTSPAIDEFDVPELDLIYCGYIFFGRPFAPETVAIGQVEPVMLASALVASERFCLEVAEPALDGALGRGELVSSSVVDWAKAAFGLDLPVTDQRLDLLAQVIQCDAIANHVDTGDWPWSANGLAAACRGLEHSPPGISFTADKIAQIARGVEDVAVFGTIKETQISAKNFTSEASTIEFTLKTALSSAPYCRLDFGFFSQSENPIGALCLDYGSGFSDPILLLPQGRVRYAAFVSTRGLQAVQWTPDQGGSGSRISMLTARPVNDEDIEGQMLTVAGPEGGKWLSRTQSQFRTNGFSSKLAFDISNRLTMDLGAHGGLLAGRMHDYDHWVVASGITPKSQTSSLQLLKRAARRLRTEWRASKLRSYLAKAFHLARKLAARMSA